MLCKICMLEAWGESNSTFLPLCPCPQGCSRSFLRAGVTPAASGRVNTSREYVLVKAHGFVEWANDSDIPYKSRNAVCRDYGTILKMGDPRFRSSGFGKNSTYSLMLRTCGISFFSYKMKMALYPKCVSRDWLKDLWCTMPWIRNLPE